MKKTIIMTKSDLKEFFDEFAKSESHVPEKIALDMFGERAIALCKEASKYSNIPLFYFPEVMAVEAGLPYAGLIVANALNVIEWKEAGRPGKGWRVFSR